MSQISRVLILDDEPLARERLRRIVQARNDLLLVAEAASIAEAQQMVREPWPDILLLDISLADGTGFDLVASLRMDKVAVVFVTAYPGFAADAFDCDAVDYVTKPINPIRVNAALDRARCRLAERAAQAELVRLSSSSNQKERSDFQQLDGFWTRRGKDHIFVDIGRVLILEAWGDYIKIATAEGEYLVNDRLAKVADRLGSEMFQQLRRSVIVARKNISVFRQGRFSSLHAVLVHGGDIRVGRTFEAEIRAQLGNARPRLKEGSMK